MKKINAILLANKINQLKFCQKSIYIQAQCNTYFIHTLIFVAQLSTFQLLVCRSCMLTSILFQICLKSFTSVQAQCNIYYIQTLILLQRIPTLQVLVCRSCMVIKNIFPSLLEVFLHVFKLNVKCMYILYSYADFLCLK